MKLNQVAKKFALPNLDDEMLDGKKDAFELCMEFLSGVDKTKTQNARHTSYGYKHMVENPASKFESPRPPDKHLLYVYEGTFVLAALASGFEMKKVGDGLTSTFNISERSLKVRLCEFANEKASETN